MTQKEITRSDSVDATDNFCSMVSVVMNGYNCEKYLRQAIDSVYSQIYQNWEIIFWDNASTDSTQSIARSYGDRLKYYRSDTNTTLGSARNSAIEKASGEFIAFLDTDDYWLPDKLILQTSILREDNEIDFVYGNCYILNQSTGRQNIWLRKVQPSGYVFGSFLRHYTANLQTVIIRRSALNSLGDLFDSELTVSEEFDLFMRLLYRSKARYIHSPIAVYRIHQNMASIKQIERYPKENEIILNKLINLYPLISHDYCREINEFKRKIAFWNARAFMADREPSKARLALAPYFMECPYFPILYLSTFFGAAWNGLLRAHQSLK
jgi:glycosyltransferase involved in cell wall biosynthesis